MPQIERSALVAFSAEQMFDLVNDVSAYSQFLPGCGGTRIHHACTEQVTASVQIQKAGVSKWFTTQNRLSHPTEIAMQLVEGPFSRLQGQWSFKPLDAQACKVSLALEFEFANALLDATFGRVFNQVASNMVDAFVQRAGVVYGGN